MGIIYKQIFSFMLGILIITCGCNDQNKETDAGNQNTDAATGSDGDADADTDADADADVDAGNDSGTDAALCEEYIDENGYCVQELGCFCKTKPWECNRRRTYEEAQKYAKEVGLTSFIGVCLYKCEEGGHLLQYFNDSDFDYHYYSESEGELIGIRKFVDYPTFCNDQRHEKYVGIIPECTLECWEICRPPMFDPPACN